ncbi:MAG: hypothetical protein JHD02_10500 [Thermoleophilaceae bacterium]|nr:hypothetical protein [Thermoleophilaceae bacterium]
MLRIANLMGVGEEDIAFLGELSPEALYEFRQQLVEVYFAEDSSLRRLAKLANIMPTSVIAKITQEAIGPILAARVVGQIDSGHAVNVLKRLPIEFVCDTAIQADPRRIKPLFSETPREISMEIADELIRRKEYVAIGQLIAFVEDDVMEHALDLAGDVDILLSSFMVEDKERLGVGVAMLSDARIRSLVNTAADQQMWFEALDLMSHMNLEEFRRIVSEAMLLSDSTLDELLTVVQENDLWYIAVPAICLADDPSGGAAALLRAKPAVRRSFIAEASSADYADDISELLEKVGDPALSKLLGPALAA